MAFPQQAYSILQVFQVSELYMWLMDGHLSTLVQTSSQDVGHSFAPVQASSQDFLPPMEDIPLFRSLHVGLLIPFRPFSLLAHFSDYLLLETKVVVLQFDQGFFEFLLLP